MPAPGPPARRLHARCVLRRGPPRLDRDTRHRSGTGSSVARLDRCAERRRAREARTPIATAIATARRHASRSVSSRRSRSTGRTSTRRPPSSFASDRSRCEAHSRAGRLSRGRCGRRISGSRRCRQSVRCARAFRQASRCANGCARTRAAERALRSPPRRSGGTPARATTCAAGASSPSWSTARRATTTKRTRGHFALVTGRVQTDGAIGDWLASNFYTLDSESEKGIVAAPVPLDNYLADLNAGQAWYRPSYLIVAVLSRPRAAALLQSALGRVYNQFWRHQLVYYHPSRNCTSISVDTLRALGFPVAARAATAASACGARAAVARAARALAREGEARLRLRRRGSRTVAACGGARGNRDKPARARGRQPRLAARSRR